MAGVSYLRLPVAQTVGLGSSTRNSSSRQRSQMKMPEIRMVNWFHSVGSVDDIGGGYLYEC